MEKKWKLSVSAEDFVQDYSPQTLKYLERLLTKFCTEAEISPYPNPTIRYTLGLNNEDGDPSPDIESKLMYMLEGYGLFEFDPNPFPGIPIITLNREGSYELVESLKESTKRSINLMERYEDGWLKNYKLSTFREWLEAIRNTLRDKELNDGVRKVASTDQLLNSIPKNKKTKHIIKIAALFKEKEIVSNFALAKCIKSSLTKKKYKLSQKDFDQEIKNRLRTLKKYWKKDGYTVKSEGDGYQLQCL